MYEWGYLTDVQRAAVNGLPVEGALAFMELMAAVVLDPWGVAGRDPERGGNMPNVPFGPGGVGQVSLLILDGPRRVWVTQVTWGG